MKEDNKKNKKNKRIIYLISGLIIMLLALITLTVYMLNNQKNDKKDITLPYTELIKDISDDSVEKIEMTVGSTSVKVKLRDVEEEKKTIVPNTQAFIQLVQDKVQQGSAIELIQKETNLFVKLSSSIFSLIPTIMMVALFILIFKMQGLGDKG